MPDGDVISRGVRFAWRASYEGVRGGDSVAVVAGRLTKSVALVLRRSGGLPDLVAAGILVGRVQSGEVTPETGLDMARSLGRGPGIGAMPLLEATQRCLLRDPTDVEPIFAIAEEVLHVIVDAEFLGRLSPDLVGERFDGVAEAAEYIADCHSALQAPFRDMARKLVLHPDAQGLRAAPVRRRRRSTLELLSQSLT
jgi:hypothetical protein